MPIIIKSSNTYDRENDIALDNSLKSISVTYKNPTLIYDTKTEEIEIDLVNDIFDDENFSYSIMPTQLNATVKGSYLEDTSPQYSQKGRIICQGTKLIGQKIINAHQDNYYIYDVVPKLRVELVRTDYDGVNTFYSVSGDSFKRDASVTTITENINNYDDKISFTVDDPYNYLNPNYKKTNISISNSKIKFDFIIDFNKEFAPTSSSAYTERYKHTMSYVISELLSSLQIKRSDDNNRYFFEFEITKSLSIKCSHWITEFLTNLQRTSATDCEYEVTKAYLVLEEKTRSYSQGNEQVETYENPTAVGNNHYSIQANRFIDIANKNHFAVSYFNTLNQYASGKEVIKLKCSVGEYYDENGNIVISTKTSDKMSFDFYDKVIPMVRNSVGQDQAISYDKNGNAKVYEVVDVEYIYDGAVWQRLTLRESNEVSEIKIQLPAPTITIANDILYIQDSSGLGKSFEIYVDGNPLITTNTTTYPIGTLSSITQGNHSVYVVSLGYENYTSSGASNVVTYVKKVPLSAPVISIIDSTLVINDTSGKAEQFAVYANGALILYTKASANTINLKSHISKEGTYTITVSAYAEGYTASAMSNEVSFTKILPLASPTITLSGKTITITDNSGKAEYFNIYVNNTVFLKIYANINVIDLSEKIAVEGKYEVFATALAQGYDESAKSNSVTYTVGDIPDVPEVPEGNYLTFVGEDGEFTLVGSDDWDGQVYISTDAQNWSEWNGNSVSSVDSKIYLRGRNNTTMRGTSSSVQAILRFSGSATKVACYGNIANLLDYSKVSAGKTNEIEMADSCFRYLFHAQTRLTRCPELPLTTLSKNCYYEMFSGCTQLSTLPKLSATTLQEYCYYRMFYNCSAIKLSETRSDEYPNEYRIPTEGNISSGLSAARYDMFANTGGTFKPTGNANILNKTLYTANEIV